MSMTRLSEGPDQNLTPKTSAQTCRRRSTAAGARRVGQAGDDLAEVEDGPWSQAALPLGGRHPSAPSSALPSPVGHPANVPAGRRHTRPLHRRAGRACGASNRRGRPCPEAPRRSGSVRPMPRAAGRPAREPSKRQRVDRRLVARPRWQPPPVSGRPMADEQRPPPRRHNARPESRSQRYHAVPSRLSS